LAVLGPVAMQPPLVASPPELIVDGDEDVRQKQAAADPARAQAEVKQREELELSRLRGKRVGMNAFLPETAVLRQGGAVSAIYVEDSSLALEALVYSPKLSKEEFSMVKFRQPVQVPELCVLVESNFVAGVFQKRKKERCRHGRVAGGRYFCAWCFGLIGRDLRQFKRRKSSTWT